ncbi:hypothetical protein RFI_00410 [Reticulomyxa filosa]|uniref:Chaperone DnaJ C-terminal domain-containing protein n=1 Tax=Reticulomyxa filosa TaxID=46433 RepID=X6PDS3_RETFI|nr:hypothetical protein RFI_00410 [Reticulomyxa filosa]|eukprot:ETO36655.1 hypothetical protein RFI_00410 [Reticulomyxa filosa]
MVQEKKTHRDCTSDDRSTLEKIVDVVYAPEDMHKFGRDHILCQEKRMMEHMQQIGALVETQQRQRLAGDSDMDTCTACSAGGIRPCEALLIFHIQGKEHGHAITFPCEADEFIAKDSIPGDVVIILHQLPHDKFVREEPHVFFVFLKLFVCLLLPFFFLFCSQLLRISTGRHLFMKKKINLADALGTGYKFSIITLDDRVLRVCCNSMNIIEPYSIKCIQNEGIPDPWDPNIRGHLFIQFEVIFPKALPPQLHDVNFFFFFLANLTKKKKS